MTSTAVLILAAGRGARMQSSRPKVLHRAGGRSLLDGVLAAVAVAGLPAANTRVVAGFAPEAVRAALAPSGIEVLLQSPQLGTGHAVAIAQSWWQAYPRLLVLNGDMPLLSAATVAGLVAAQRDRAAAIATAAPALPRAYGRVLRRGDRIVGIVEDRQATPEQRAIRELNAGFYCFDTAALAPALARLTADNPHREYYLTDAIGLLAHEGNGVVGYTLADEAECLGVNDRAELAQLDQLLRRRSVAALLARGVSIQLPDTVVIDAEVEVGPDSLLEPGVQLLGRTRIGARCEIRSYSVLRDCDLGDGVLVRPHCVMEGARIEEDAVIGPYARLREGAEIGRGAHIGNFVEVKKTRVGAGAKANHLAYLGDASVGAGANIGAGAITCNYDGERKHPTAIGDGAFVGSNSTLVAPVEIGDGAYIAAGSTITENVPARALAFGRARQLVKPAWRKSKAEENLKPEKT